MKKMIPVYLIQLGILAAVLVIGMKVLREVRGMRSDVAAVTSKTPMREPVGSTPALRIKVVGGVYVDNLR